MKTKTKTIILIALFATTSMLQAQNNSVEMREKTTVGLKAGVNYSNIYQEKGNVYEADPKAGLAAGVFFSIPIGPFLGIQPEVMFSQKGYQANGNILGAEYEFSRTMNFIDVPILLAIKPIEQLTIFAGPQYSYLMKQTDDFSIGSLNILNEKDFDNSNIRKNTFGFVTGFDINISHIVIGARAGWDLLNNNGDGTSSEPQYKNVYYQATIGVRL